MYLISLYFDEKTEGRFRSYINQIAKTTGNDAMTDGNIPPHITVSAFHAYKEETALEIFRSVIPKITAGEVQFVSVGSFFPQVLFAAPVLNEYLYQISTAIYKEVTRYEEVVVGERTRPFSWMPHITIGRELSQTQLLQAFEIMQKQFAPFKGKVVKMGLAKTNPYMDIGSFVLK